MLAPCAPAPGTPPCCCCAAAPAAWAGGGRRGAAPGAGSASFQCTQSSPTGVKFESGSASSSGGTSPPPPTLPPSLPGVLCLWGGGGTAVVAPVGRGEGGGQVGVLLVRRTRTWLSPRTAVCKPTQAPAPAPAPASQRHRMALGKSALQTAAMRCQPLPTAASPCQPPPTAASRRPTRAHLDGSSPSCSPGSHGNVASPSAARLRAHATALRAARTCTQLNAPKTPIMAACGAQAEPYSKKNALASANTRPAPPAA